MQPTLRSIAATTLRRPASQPATRPGPRRLSRTFAAWSVWSVLLPTCLLPLPARAADGCLVLLCLAAPNWHNVAQCVDPVREVLRDLARGHPFPTCAMSGRGNSASNRPASAPDDCPIQYARSYEMEGQTIYVCDYAGVVDLDVDGAPWTRVWWSASGDSVTEFTPAARARLGTWDSRFEDDYSRWLASQPTVTSFGASL